MAKKVKSRNENDYAIALGALVVGSNAYIAKFKSGGEQKLQKLIGEEFFYKNGKEWYYSKKLSSLPITKLLALTKKVQNANG